MYFQARPVSLVYWSFTCHSLHNMKYCALILIAAGVSSAADFTTGQAARSVVGQATFTQQSTASVDNTASQDFLGAASGVAYANGLLFVADSNRVGAFPQNNRVLIYDDYPAKKYGPTASIDATTRCPLCGGTPRTVLGQQDFTTVGIALTQSGLRSPTAVAADDQHLVVADTDNNRVLIWNTIPASNGVPADVVVGQPDFKTGTSNFGGGNTPSAKGLRGPQGVWLQGGKLFVADTQNHRVLIWNSIPTSNGAAADVVLGQGSFTAFVQPDLTQTTVTATPSNLLNPVSVTSDGQHLFVADLGHNRVLIWNSIPSTNAAPADVVIGQPSLQSSSTIPASVANNSANLCESNGTDATTKALTFPARCASTLDFPRFALSDGTRLFVADGGNNRVLVFNTIPTTNGVRADAVLGQADEFTAEDDVQNRISAADTLRTPMSLAWDGTNLYVSDTFNRRIVLFNPAEPDIDRTGVRNAFSREIFSVASIAFSGSIKEGDVATVTISGTDYKYTIVKDDTFDTLIQKIVNLINGANNGAGDPNVFARANTVFAAIVLTARKAGPEGDLVSISTTVSTNASIILTTSGSLLSGSRDPAQIAPGTVLLVLGNNLANGTFSAPTDASSLPKTLGGVELYVDGVPVPLFMVSPTEIRAQLPYEVSDATSVSAYVRITDANGRVRVTSPVGISVIGQNPGILAGEGTDPRPAIAYHYSSYANGAVSIDGTIKEGDTGTITIEDRPYAYTVTAADTLETVRNALINAINSNGDEKVTAYPGSIFNRVRLQSKIPGKEGEGIAYTASTSTGAQLVLSPYSTTLCCSNTAGAPVTEDNPAVPGETIVFFTTGLGLVKDMTAVKTGEVYSGPSVNEIVTQVDAIAGNKTANVLSVGLATGQVGVYELQLQLNSDLPTNPQTQVTIAQDIDISNVVTIPVNNPTPPQ